jgi:glycosyltransferase involved in cell wall biosynthesis
MASVLEHHAPGPSARTFNVPEAVAHGSSTRSSRPIVFLAWGAVAGRSEEIAAAIGGQATCFFPPGPTRRPPVLVRWVLSAIGTVGYLVRHRPKVVIVTNPPIFAPLVAYACARLIGATVVMDSHPGGFGAQGDRVAAKLQPLHRWMVRRAALVLVTDDSWSETVRDWGGTPAVIHEAPTDWVGGPPRRHQRLRVLVVGRFGRDEPVHAVIDAARARPECDFLVTGDPAALDAELRSGAPSNVTFVGFLDAAHYRGAVMDSDAVLTLTTEPTSVMRAAYEAVYARRPVVISDWPVGRELFPHALHTRNDAVAIARAIATLDADYDRYAGTVEGAGQVQLDRWLEQRRVLLDGVAAAP